MADRSPTITAREKQQAAAREVSYRFRVYEGLVARGRMTRSRADREIAVMRAIAADYEAIALQEERRAELPLEPTKPTGEPR